MSRKPDRPKNPFKLRSWSIVFKDGQSIIVVSQYRASARHYSKYARDNWKSSKEHYKDIKSVRLLDRILRNIPF